MKDDQGPRYFNDDGSEFNPGLRPAPDLCVSCAKNESHDADEEVVCNLTRTDQQDNEVFLCFGYQPISSSIDREAVLRGLCEQAGVKYPDEGEIDSDSGPTSF